MRLFTCEPGDSRINRAVRTIAPDLNLETLNPNYDSQNTHGIYTEGIRALKTNRADIVLAGAGIALSEFLSLLFSELRTSRSKQLLYAVAPMESEEGPFVLVDPCVLIDPQAEELAQMASGAAELYQAIFARMDASIAVLSHSTGSYTHHRDTLAAQTVTTLAGIGSFALSEVLLQVDAALSPAAARRKAAALSKRPSVLVCTGVGVANAIYKTIEVFGRSRVKLAGAILMGLDHGVIGLLPRTCTQEDVARLVGYSVRAVRGLSHS